MADIRVLTNADAELLSQLMAVFKLTFDGVNETVDSRQLQQLLSHQSFVAFAVIVDGLAVGGTTAYKLPLYDGHTELFIYDVAIHPNYQRRGFGKLLITTVKDYCAAHGISTMYVAAHRRDTHALRFYEATGGKGEDAVMFTYDGASEQGPTETSK